MENKNNIETEFEIPSFEEPEFDNIEFEAPSFDISTFETTENKLDDKTENFNFDEPTFELPNSDIELEIDTQDKKQFFETIQNSIDEKLSFDNTDVKQDIQAIEENITNEFLNSEISKTTNFKIPEPENAQTETKNTNNKTEIDNLMNQGTEKLLKKISLEELLIQSNSKEI